MDLATIALLIGSGAFALFGVWLFATPKAMGAVDIAADSPNARVEIRAMYGGLELALAVFLFMCIGNPDHQNIGLFLQMLAIGGIALGRLVGIALERGRAKGLLRLFFAIEAAATIFTAAAFIGFTSHS